MAKLLIFVALCIASTMAVPNFSVLRTKLELAKMKHDLKSVDGNIGTCAEALVETVVAAAEAAAVEAQGCAKDAAEEIVKLEEELFAAASKAAAAVQEQIAALKACADNECKVAAIKEIAGIIAAYVQDAQKIVDSHLANLEEKFPEAAVCVKKVILSLSNQIKAAGIEFIACVKA